METPPPPLFFAKHTHENVIFLLLQTGEGETIDVNSLISTRVSPFKSQTAASPPPPLPMPPLLSLLYSPSATTQSSSSSSVSIVASEMENDKSFLSLPSRNLNSATLSLGDKYRQEANVNYGISPLSFINKNTSTVAPPPPPSPSSINYDNTSSLLPSSQSEPLELPSSSSSSSLPLSCASVKENYLDNANAATTATLDVITTANIATDVTTKFNDLSLENHINLKSNKANNNSSGNNKNIIINHMHKSSLLSDVVSVSSMTAVTNNDDDNNAIINNNTNNSGDGILLCSNNPRSVTEALSISKSSMDADEKEI